MRKGLFMVNTFSSVSNDLAALVDEVGQSVVQVDARRRMPASGLVWSEDGLIVTSSHVVQREENITIGLADGGNVKAQLVGRDPGTDLVLLRVDAEGLDIALNAEAAFGPAADRGTGS
jgi:S1-C subfamily serine protease